MSELKNETAKSSARLVKQMLRDMRWHAGRLDDPSSVESVPSLAGTLSESVKKLSQILDDTLPEQPDEPRQTVPRIDMAAVENFIAVTKGDRQPCPKCGGMTSI